ncbi:crotonobetaine/carnitine-CoA ligase [Rhodoligotrophos appendicifer]|uniref:class I adenylate-forming enzyme family protein n=1 Tax=Rhodoligotrophos appendicifer TaxID=987056 RepID=UPI001961838F|nr:class I adenylate-forming enzyme family protein [Rhodoligotrophos appendicifer]
MKRRDILAQSVTPVEERIRLIESAPLPPNVPTILEDAAAAVPDTVALNFFEEGVSLTYAELLRSVHGLARGFSALGIGPGTRVGVMLPNIVAFPITWLALGRLGAVMIPLNIGYTSREVAYVLGDAGAEWLCLHEDAVAVIEQIPVGQGRPADDRTIVVGKAAGGRHSWDQISEAGTKSSADLPALATIEPDRLLNIQYTSGTTGMPKGCLLTHRYWVTSGTVNAFRDGRKYKHILAAVPFFYMDPQWLLLMTLLHRGTLFTARRQSASRFMHWVRDFRIHFTLFPEIVFKRPPEPEDADNEIIRVNVYGLSRETHQALEERYDVIAREAFGMTEIGSGMFMPMEATQMVGSGSCGRPSPFREARIVGPDGRVLAAGEAGELQIRGPGILLGYHNKPEATTAAFDDGWFRTGDLARQDEEGFYYIVGRLKDMIRRAGENIAASEVESVLRSAPQIVEAAAVPVPDEMRGEEVKAFIVLGDGFTADTVPPKEIFDFCAQKLARFKVPRYLAYRGPLPKTPSEKIAKQVLLREEEASPSATYDFVENRWT